MIKQFGTALALAAIIGIATVEAGDIEIGSIKRAGMEIGVGPWWKPIDLEWDFVFAGYGKKGGY